MSRAYIPAPSAASQVLFGGGPMAGVTPPVPLLLVLGPSGEFLALAEESSPQNRQDARSQRNGATTSGQERESSPRSGGIQFIEVTVQPSRPLLGLPLRVPKVMPPPPPGHRPPLALQQMVPNIRQTRTPPTSIFTRQGSTVMNPNTALFQGMLYTAPNRNPSWQLPRQGSTTTRPIYSPLQPPSLLPRPRLPPEPTLHPPALLPRPKPHYDPHGSTAATKAAMQKARAAAKANARGTATGPSVRPPLKKGPSPPTQSSPTPQLPKPKLLRNTSSALAVEELLQDITDGNPRNTQLQAIASASSFGSSRSMASASTQQSERVQQPRPIMTNAWSTAVSPAVGALAAKPPRGPRSSPPPEQDSDMYSSAQFERGWAQPSTRAFGSSLAAEPVSSLDVLVSATSSHAQSMNSTSTTNSLPGEVD